METAVAALLLITTAVMFSVVVIDYSVNIMQQSLNTKDLPQLKSLTGIENNLLNQTDQAYGNQTGLPTQSSP